MTRSERGTAPRRALAGCTAAASASGRLSRPGSGIAETVPSAVLPEGLLAAGVALALVADGLRLLAWLLDAETCRGRPSVVPVAGRGPLDRGPAFDQQPIEVAALVDACARAHAITGQDRWLDGIDRAAARFLGTNDVGVPLYDPGSGGYDGLERDGRNENQGAGSTLAFVSTVQQVRARQTARRNEPPPRVTPAPDLRRVG